MTGIVQVIDCETGDVIEREQTSEEVADVLACVEEANAIRSEEASMAAAAITAVEKLQNLGLTENEIHALLGR